MLGTSLVADSLGTGNIEVAFPEMERNFIERAPLPFFGLCQPEVFSLGIQWHALGKEIPGY